MHVISFVSQKGGSGKSCLSTSIAVAAEQGGLRVLMLDMDSQGSAEAWYQDREADTPKLARVDASALARTITQAKAADFDVVIIDTPGRDDPASAAAIRAADLCVVPCRPTAADMKATPATAATIKRLNKLAAFVLTQTPARGFRTADARTGLAMLGMVCPVHIVSRSSYQDAFAAGLGATEHDPGGKAAEEVKALWVWLSSRLKKVPAT